MKKRIGVAALAIAILIAIIGYVIFYNANEDPTITKVSLRLPIPVVHTSFSPYYLAVDKGMFLKHGLDVSIEPGSPELNPVKMVSQGIDAFGVVGGPELLFSGRNKGAGIIGIALLHNDADFVVIATLKNSGITKVSQLEGKKVGFFYGHISTDILHMLFKKENVQVEEIDVGFNYGQLISGEIDAQWAFRTTAGLSLPAKGIPLNFISPADYGIITQGHMIIANETMVKENPDIVQRFLVAVLEAINYSLDNTQEAIDSAVKRDPNFSREIGQQQMEILRSTILGNTRIGWIPEDAMEKTKQQMLSVDLLPDDFDIESAYTTRFLEHYYTTK